MREYQILKVHGKQHIVASSNRPDFYRQPNYMGTGKALVAVLDANERFEDWWKLKGKAIDEKLRNC